MKIYKLNVFIILFTSSLFYISCSSTGIVGNAINRGNSVEEEKVNSYLMLNDGTIITVNEGRVSNAYGIINTVKIDGVTYKTKEVKAYKIKDYYYHRINNDYGRRIIRGKINVYYLDKQEFVKMASGSTERVIHYSYYLQKGEDQPIKRILYLEDIQQYISDCPKAVEALKAIKDHFQRRVRESPNLVNDVIDIYNNGCK